MVLVYLYLFHFLLSHVLVFIILLERLKTIIVKTNRFSNKVGHIIKMRPTSFCDLNVFVEIKYLIFKRLLQNYLFNFFNSIYLSYEK